MNYVEMADRYLARCAVTYRGRINYNVKEFIRGFAWFLEKMDTANAGSKRPTQIALITENNSHLTGGRYYAYFMGCALVEAGFEVTMYTNAMPNFIKFFDGYRLPKIEIIPGVAQNLETADIIADAYIGSPISGNLAAIRNGKRYSKPSYPMVFDPFPMLKKFQNKEKFAGWDDLEKELRGSNTSVITLCEATHPYIHDWLDKTDDQLIPIYPCVNSRAKDAVPEQKREDFVLFISRLVPSKRFDHVLDACKTIGINLKVVASVNGVDARRMVEAHSMQKRTEIIFKATEKQKFELIKKAKAVINGAVFEGFGIWAAEAIDCGTPVVCYEYPTLREIQRHSGADNMYFAKHDDRVSLTKQLELCLSEAKFNPPSNHFGFEAMVARVTKVFTVEPKIGVVMIALNEQQLIGASLKSITKHKNIHKVAVIEGAVDLFPTHKDYLSVDGTRDEILKVMKTQNGSKILYERYGRAKDKSELRNRALEMLTECHYILVVDADEFYTQDDLNALVDAVKKNPSVQTFVYPFYHYWKNKKQITTGSNWDVMMPRFFKLSDKGTRWEKHQHFPVDSQGQRLDTISQMTLPIHCHHFGYCKPDERVIDKLNYYRARDKGLTVIDTFTNWQPGQDTQPTHQGGVVVPYEGDQPPEVVAIL